MSKGLSKTFMEKIGKVMDNAQKQIKEILASYEYNDQLSHEQNMDQLVNKLQVFAFDKNILNSFRSFLKNSFNIPIQVNFKPLRFEQLAMIIDDWLLHHESKSVILRQRELPGINWRNQLFRRVCFQQRQTIDQFFQINSKNKDKKQIKGFDLYQLLVLILSDYFLYEKLQDQETFFDKQNSFNLFLSIVEKYENNEMRMAYLNMKKISKASEIDKEYIQRFEFQRFLEFWESDNSQLILLATKRQNRLTAQTQTASIIKNSNSVQTFKSYNSSLSGIIENALHDLNVLFQRQCNGNILKEMGIIYDFLKHQKIKLTQDEDQIIDEHDFTRSNKTTKSKNKKEKKIVRKYKSSNNSHQQNKTSKFSPPMTPSPIKKNKYQSSQNYEKQKILFTYAKNNQIFQSKQINKQFYHQEIRNNSVFQNNFIRSTRDLLFIIFSHYTLGYQFIDINRLNHFFYEIGLINFGQIHIILNLMEYQIIYNTNHISFIDFQRIINQLMRQDPSLTWNIIQQFAREKSLLAREHLQKNLPSHLFFQIAASAFDKNLIKQHQVPYNMGEQCISPSFKSIHHYTFGDKEYENLTSENDIYGQKIQIPPDLRRAFQQGALFTQKKPNKQKIHIKQINHSSKNKRKYQQLSIQIDGGQQADQAINDQQQKNKQKLYQYQCCENSFKKSKKNLQYGRRKMQTQYNKQSSQDSLL